MDNDNKNEEPDIEPDIKAIPIDGDSEEAGLFIAKLIGDYLESSSSAEVAMKNLCYILNTAGSSIAMRAALGKYGSEDAEELAEADSWPISPKEMIEFLLEQDLIADREYLAEAFREFKVVKELEEMFNAPSKEV